MSRIFCGLRSLSGSRGVSGGGLTPKVCLPWDQSSRLWGISVSKGFQCQSMVALDAAQQLPRTSAGDRGPPLPARSWLTNNSRSPGQARQTMAASTGVVEDGLRLRPGMNCRSAKYRPMGQATPTTTYLALAEGAKGLVGCTLPHRCLDVCIFQPDRGCLTSVRWRAYESRQRSGPPDTIEATALARCDRSWSR